jgi:alkanesulfonate monooxygenase SsuD/methylene tetrahydromethanopterin reductase-like flavin-dependent oxidoreductase (luciferase family)
VQVDVLLDPFGARWSEMRDAALLAEESGFDGVWTWDHLAGSVHRAPAVLECWTTLTALAATVRRVTIGPLVLNVANRDPGTLAVMAATLQEVSGGRLVLGIGAGGGLDTPYAAEQRALGRPVRGDRGRRQQLEVAIATLREVWTGRAGGASGFLRPDPEPKIVVGAFGPKMAELAGRVGDGINLQAGHPELDRLAGIARDAYRKRGKEPEGFLVTAFAGLDDRWVRAGGAEQARLARAGVKRLILLVPPRALGEIGQVGRHLAQPA